MTTQLTPEQITKGVENAQKTNLINKAAQALADCCTENNVTIDEVLPMLISLTKRKMQ